MYKQNRTFVMVATVLFAMLVVFPVFAQGAQATKGGMLGCQRNNPDRSDCSSLEVSGYCDADVAVFVIHNTGEAGNGDMRSPTQYTILVDGETVETGDIQLHGDGTMEVRYDGGGTVTLYAEQQIGHPGNSHPRTTLECGNATPTPNPTSEPTETSTVEPTPIATEEVIPMELDVVMICEEDGLAIFTVTNIGGDMTESVDYDVTDGTNGYLTAGLLQLMADESFTIEVFATSTLVLRIGDEYYTFNPECATQPNPTEEPQEPPYVDVYGDCWYGDGGGWMVTNYGGDMLDPMYYEVVDTSGVVLFTGDLLLLSGESTEIDVYEYGEFTLNINYGEYIFAFACEEPVSTEEPQDPPYVDVYGDCWYGDGGGWMVTNYGGDMLDPMYYEVVDTSGVVLFTGDLLLLSGESTEIDVYEYGEFTLNINYGEYIFAFACEEPVSTEEPQDPPYVDVYGDCWYGDGGGWMVSNYGGDMLDPMYYEVVDTSGVVLVSGDLLLLNGESTEIDVYQYGEFTLNINYGMNVSTFACEEPVSTEEPTPDPLPTEEPTPDPLPTEEPTPNPLPTEQPPLGCQQNNPDRLDCSSLEVTGYCDGSTAVFIIRNTGEPGNGDMRATTSYRIMIDGMVVESGTVQINGGATMEVLYESGGSVTLYADQQIGHPGNSQPQTTLSCG